MENVWRKKPLDIPAKHNLDTALSTIGLVNDEMISMENKRKQDHQSSHLVFAHLECCISSHSHRAKLILRQFRAAITSKHHQSTTEADRSKSTQIRVTDATTNLVSFSIFCFSYTEKQHNNKHEGKVQHLPFCIMLPSCKIFESHFIHQRSQIFFDNHFRCLWTCLWHSCHFCPLYHLSCLENQNPVGECCGNTSDTFDP